MIKFLKKIWNYIMWHPTEIVESPAAIVPQPKTKKPVRKNKTSK